MTPSSRDLYIIAECAQGYASTSQSDSYQLARSLVQAASCGTANAVKFQLVFADEIATPDYQYYNTFKSLELPPESWSELATYAETLAVDLILDVFGTQSLQIAEAASVKAIKVHPTDFTNTAFLQQISSSSIPCVYAGTGGSTSEEVKSLLEILSSKTVCLLHGFQAYPTPPEANDLLRIHDLTHISLEHPSCHVGFADHSISLIESQLLSSVALGLGCRLIEKHLTLSNCLQMEDSESALNPDDFRTYVQSLKSAYSSLGKKNLSPSVFQLSECELSYRTNVQRHLVASCDIPALTTIKPCHISLKRSATRDPYNSASQIVGRITQRPISRNSAFTSSDFRDA